MSTRIEQIISLFHEDLQNKTNNRPMKNKEKIKQLSSELMEIEIKYNSMLLSQNKQTEFGERK